MAFKEGGRYVMFYPVTILLFCRVMVLYGAACHYTTTPPIYCTDHNTSNSYRDKAMPLQPFLSASYQHRISINLPHLQYIWSKLSKNYFPIRRNVITTKALKSFSISNRKSVQLDALLSTQHYHSRQVLKLTTVCL